jgi:hypothetical protein
LLVFPNRPAKSGRFCFLAVKKHKFGSSENGSGVYRDQIIPGMEQIQRNFIETSFFFIDIAGILRGFHVFFVVAYPGGKNEHGSVSYCI